MRQMATVRKIDSIESIPDADFLEVAVVGGWRVVVRKGEYAPNDLAVYLEIDSFVPDSVAPFLTQEGHFPKEYLGVKGQKLKTKKLRGVLSQGLLLQGIPATGGLVVNDKLFQEGEDVSEHLGIVKYEPPVAACLAGLAKGSFPSVVPKTDQERIQNLNRNLEIWKKQCLTWEVTEKLEGSSVTFFLPKDGEFEVCSRNLSLKRSEENSFWKAAIQEQVEEKMREHNLFDVAIQGELVGESIQGNIYQLKGQTFYVFDVYSVFLGRYLSPKERRDLIEKLGFKHVPVLETEFDLSDLSMDDIIAFADSKSVIRSQQDREGIVFKCNEEGHSFKSISGKYLLKQKD